MYLLYWCTTSGFLSDDEPAHLKGRIRRERSQNSNVFMCSNKVREEKTITQLKYIYMWTTDHEGILMMFECSKNVLVEKIYPLNAIIASSMDMLKPGVRHCLKRGIMRLTNGYILLHLEVDGVSSTSNIQQIWRKWLHEKTLRKFSVA